MTGENRVAPSIVARPLSDAPGLCRLSATEMTKAFSRCTLSPVEAAEVALARAADTQSRYNAFVSLDVDGALAAARASSRRWQEGRPLSALDGVPTTIKDVVSVKDWHVRYGTAFLGAHPCEEDSPAVERLRNAGAVLIGLTTTPEFGWKAVTDNRVDGTTLNPWNRELTSGGSSGGAAVAAATGAGVLHLGTDGGGSVRIPASFCGVVGFKPSYGRIAAHPPSSFGTLAHIGPITRSVSDARLMFETMQGRDIRDWTQSPNFPNAAAGRTKSLEGLRIGYWSKPATGSVETEVGAAVGGCLSLLEAVGAIVEPFTLPDYDLLDIFHVLWLSGAARRISLLSRSEQSVLDPALALAASEAASMSAVRYVDVASRRAAYGAEMDANLERFDLLISPAVAVLPFEAGRLVPAGSDMQQWFDWAGFNYPINLSQQPALVLPLGSSADGRPIGLQLVGARGRDEELLAIGELVERVLGKVRGA